MREAISYLRSLQACPLIVFVGHISRTAYADENTVLSAMEILREATPYWAAHGTPCGFDLVVKKIADYIGLNRFEVAHTSRAKDGSILRDVGLLDGADMLVAFPQEKYPEQDAQCRVIKQPKTRSNWRTADVEITTMAESMGVPVLVVYRDASTLWVPGASYVQ